MNIQSGYYEAGIALFWLLFAYLFSSCSRDSLAKYVSERHAAAWQKLCGALPDGSIR